MAFRRLSACLIPVWLSLASPSLAQSLDGTSTSFSFRFSVDYFVQVSSRQNFAFSDESYSDVETFMWERLRPKLSGNNGRVSFLIEGQDTHSLGSRFVVRKAWLDVLNAYVDIKGPEKSGLTFRIGRRQGDFDAIPRMVRTPDFAAVVRSFDLAEVKWQRRDTEARAFVFRTVDNLPDRFNTWKRGERLWSLYFRQGVGKQQLQTYVTTRLNTDAVAESGARGSGAVYAWEVLASGPLGVPGLTYQVEHILERGHAATDRVKASGLFASVFMTPLKGHDGELRYIRTSGDRQSGDGVKQAYDTFYMAIGPLSPLGVMRGQNMHSLSMGAQHDLTPRVTAIWRVHEHRLNTLADGWYSSRFIRRPGATSTRIGSELDLLFSYAMSRHLTARVGYFRLWQGGYMKDTGSYGSPYEVRFQMYGAF